LQPREAGNAATLRDCPCPGVFKAVAYCDDCPYSETRGDIMPTPRPDKRLPKPSIPPVKKP